MKNKERIIKIVKTIIILIIITMLIWIVSEEHTERNIKNEEEKIAATKAKHFSITSINKETKKYPKEEIITTYQGYPVCAKLEIPEISLETYILSQYSDQALNISVTKFWGTEPNKIGNFCVAGHNFINKNMFRNLKKLKIGDKLSITDNTIGKVEYEIYKIDTVMPKDTSCLDQNTKNKEVTLITCTNDSQKRIIVKAKEAI